VIISVNFGGVKSSPSASELDAMKVATVLGPSGSPKSPPLRPRRRPCLDANVTASGWTVAEIYVGSTSPIPDVTTSDDPLPTGLTYTRYPTDQGSWIVLNGTVGGKEYYAKTTFDAAHRASATINWHVVEPRPPQPASIGCFAHPPFYVGEVVHDEWICHSTGPITMSGDPPPNGLTYTYKDIKYKTQVLLNGTVSEQARGSSGKTRFAVSPTVSTVYSWSVYKS
jgi:hypothetical protein